MGTFKKLTANFANLVEDEALKVVRQAVQDMIINMQVPVKKGGKMPVDTGFLRWSGAGSVNKIPVGEDKGRDRNENDPATGPLLDYVKPQGDFVQNELAKLKTGDTFYWGWTAIYAYVQEMRHGFMESETDKWQEYIDSATKRLK